MKADGEDSMTGEERRKKEAREWAELREAIKRRHFQIMQERMAPETALLKYLRDAGLL